MSISKPKEFRSNIIKNMQQFIKDPVISTNLEKAIYNYSIKEGTKKKIVKRWDNRHFVQIYTSEIGSDKVSMHRRFN